MNLKDWNNMKVVKPNATDQKLIEKYLHPNFAHLTNLRNERVYLVVPEVVDGKTDVWGFIPISKLRLWDTQKYYREANKTIDHLITRFKKPFEISSEPMKRVNEFTGKCNGTFLT